MRTFAARVRLAAALVVAAAALGLGISVGSTPRTTAHKAQPAKKDPLAPTGPDDVVTGFTTCRACHNEKYPIDAADNPFAKKFRSHEFVLLGEGRTWTREDPHSTAFEVLKRPLGQQMTRVLGYEVTKDARCLTCHAIDKNPGVPLPTREPDVLARFDRSEGVTCNACHGLRRPWQGEHYAEKDTPDGGRTIPWRTYDTERKEASGMRNLRDPVVKARLCVSCHVGSPDEGKVVTHEMYAAGHPPLPPFELATFMECQPRHWGYPVDPGLKFFTPAGFAAYSGADLAKARPNWTWELYRFHPAEKEVYLARQLAAGAITSLQAELRMIAEEAAKAAAGHGDGVDFARFDCLACHHDLKSPSDRQARGYAGPPGRPPLKAWVGALPSVVVEHAAGLPKFADLANDFRPRWEAVQRAALARPFGKPDELARAAGELSAWCDEFLTRQQSESDPVYTPEEATKLLAAIGVAAAAPRWAADPEAAMSLTWAYVTLRRHMTPDIPPGKLDALGKTIPVQVRTGPYSTDTGEPRTAGDTLRQRLELFGRYRSNDFTAAFQDLLGPKK